MKSPQDFLDVLARRLDRVWAGEAAGEVVEWNGRVALGKPTGPDFTRNFTAHAAWAREWFTWAQHHGLTVEEENRRVGTSSAAQTMPVAAAAATPAAAAALLGGPWPARREVAATRAGQVRALFPHLVPGPALTSLVRTVTGWSALDFELLCQAGAWFAAHDATGLTPRQVPIPGMHAKWLNTRQGQVCLLAGIDTLALATAHASRVHFTYLDPEHLRAGGRRHDSHTVGDHVQLAYAPSVVIICENKDTVATFPPVASAIAVEGNGRGAGAIASLGWVTAAPHVAYWGDMDADGLEILQEFRAAGVPATSLLMDLGAYRAWALFGTRHDRFGRELMGRDPRPTPDLSGGERALYEQLCDPAFTGYRRVEQERIPLPVALADLLATIALS